MAYKVCKYRLNADGTIPDFLHFGHDPMGMHGVYVVVDSDTDAPRDNVSGFGFFFRTILRYWFRVLIFGLGAGAITYLL